MLRILLVEIGNCLIKKSIWF